MKSSIFFQEREQSKALHAIVVDQNGLAARVLIEDIPDMVLRVCDGLKIEETGQVFKPCRRFRFPSFVHYPLPLATPLYAYLRCNYDRLGDQAMLFRIGLRASNGFSIPSQDVIDKVYVPVDSPPQFGDQ
jgi:hypothetical protein